MTFISRKKKKKEETRNTFQAVSFFAFLNALMIEFCFENMYLRS